MNKIFKASSLIFCLVYSVVGFSEDAAPDLRRVDPEKLQQLVEQSKRPPKDLTIRKLTDDTVLDQKSNDTILSQIYDSVTPVTRTIFIDTENTTSEMAEIKLARNRSTIIPFFKQGMEPLKIQAVFMKSNSNVDKVPRFTAEHLKETVNFVEFATNSLTGWNTVEIMFEGYNELVPLKLVAGSDYELSSKAVVLSNNIDKRSSGFNEKVLNGNGNNFGTIQSYTQNTGIKKALIEFANSGITPNGALDKQFAVELFQVPPGLLPSVIAYNSKIDGENYILLRTNGILIEPDYTFSQPAKTLTENVYAYAIPIKSSGRFISIEYQEKRFIYQLANRGILNAIQN